MKDLKVGDVIQSTVNGDQIKVNRADHTRYDVDGVPSIVEGNFVSDGIKIQISFGGLPGQKIADWREYTVVSRC